MKKKLRITAVAMVIMFVMLIGNVFSQQVNFNKLNPSKGQSFEQFLSIAQDINGTMWFCTSNGVYSYDGSQIKTFKNNALNPNSLANNFAHSVCADKNGMIWIATMLSGLDMLNPETGDFTHFTNDPNNPASLVNDTVIVVFIDRQGIYWIGTNNGLDKFDPETNTFFHYKYDANDTTSISNNQVRVIYEDRKGTLWIGTGTPYLFNGGSAEDGGLNKLNRETGTFTRYMHDSNNIHSLENNKVSAIFEDNEGTFWVGTWKKGIQKMDREKGTFEPAFTETELPELRRDYKLPNVGLANNDYISFITQDVAGKIWFATSASGIFNYDPVTKKIIFIYGPENSTSGFTEKGARTAFSSRDGILWFGTDQFPGNVFYLDPAIKKIQHTSVSGSSVSSFYEEQNGDFWIGTMNEITRNIRKSGEIKRYGTDDYKINDFNNRGYLVRGDREGNIWLATTQSLNRFDKKTEKFIAYKHDPENISSISDSYIINTYEDSKSNFWIGTADGLNLMDRKTGLFKRFYANPEYAGKRGNNVISSITEDKLGFLWIGNWNRKGVNRFNPESKDFKDYLKGVSVGVLFLDSDSILWAGTGQGLFKYNPGIDNFIPFTVEGLMVNIPEVSSIVEDKQKNLWLTTDNQIVRINRERDETSYFGQNYGVGQNGYNFHSGYIKRNGEIYFGDETGYFSFFPDKLINSLKVPEIVFTGFMLSDKKLMPGDGGPLTQNLNELKKIQLAYDQNVFSIDLSIIDYANPEQNVLIYSLENYDINWHNANSERKAYYFNVPPGKYTFRVKGVNSYGAWAEKTIDIIIMPPWWLTIWAYSIYALLLITLIFGFDRFMRRRIVERERKKVQERELAQAKEIEKAYKNLEVAHESLKSAQTQLIQSEKMASLGELTAGIAHEIQNPLNFVNNFSEVSTELIVEIEEERAKNPESRDENLVSGILSDIKQNLEKINHHGKRADAIVKGMLQHSRTSNGQKEPTDINALADEYLRLSYHGLRAKDKSFNADFKTEFDETLPKINVIPQDIGRVMLNLINNAFYAVSEARSSKLEDGSSDYKPEVIVSTKKLGDKIEIRVKDNGTGIPEDVREKIFQPFFTTKPTGQGTGLGLSMSYDIVKVHGGELKVESKVGTGTEFIIQIPNH